ncbi:NKG2-A/NKG2-B type II integral membrane protein-like [Talpa occidentalis]|uniref:NKG2-A/NKG2-B type II integral membrane protein-like n=1 Tax=Talpa occidentalis TaxID=50954 RepID=UPI00188FBBD5|nr:NKG2-A/NKG2-B type II integral membrane protein-like [Talpa occidentalis]
MSNGRVTYAELKVAKGAKRHQIKPKGTKRSVSIPEKEITYADLNLQNVSPALQGNDKKYHCKGLAATPEKLIAGILGLTCLVLICIIVAVIIIYCRHCGPCAKEWLTYSNSCYYISPEKKTWNESVMACAANNSHLLYIDNQEEMVDDISISGIAGQELCIFQYSRYPAFY